MTTQDERREQEMDAQIVEIVGYLRETWPTAADWNVLEDGTDDCYAEILDPNDAVLGYISERQLTAYWNRAERFLIVRLGGDQ